MKTKKLHNSFSKASVIRTIAFFVLFASLITNSLSAKDAFIWNGNTSNDWATTTNWTITRGTVPGTSTYPGEVGATDSVVVSNGGTPSLASGLLSISTLTVSNATGASSGSTLTISNGATLAVSGIGTTVIPTVLLKGGNIVNNGALNITSSATGVGYGIICSTPVVAPGSATTYSYSGSGSLSINTSTGTGCSVAFNGTNANSTYKIAFPSATTLTLKANAAALSVASNTTSPVLISGKGFTLGSSGSGVAAGILTQNGNGTNVTIDAGTTLTLYSLTGNTAKAVYLYFSAAGGGSFTNNGTININGPIAGCINLTNSAGTGSNNLSFINNGTISANVAISSTYSGVMNIVNGAATYGANTNAISNTGTMTLVNTSAAANTGYCLYHGNGAITGGPFSSTITNSGTFELNGTLTSTGGVAGRLTINNTGTFILNLPSTGTSCLDKTIFNNNSGGTLDCKTATISSGTGYVVTLNTGSTLKTASLTSYSLSGSGAVQNTGVSYVLYGAAAQTTGTYIPASINNLTINNAAGVTLGSAVTVNGTLTLTSGAFTIGNNTLTLNGVAANNGGTLTHYSKGSLIFSGSSAQNFPSLSNNKCKLITLNNSAGVSLNAGIEIDSTLTLTSGKLSLEANDLTIGTKGSIAGATSTNYIVTNGAGKLNQNVGSATSILFPVGASVSSYDPVNVTPTTGTSFGVRAYTVLSGTPAYGVRYNPKEWDITPVVASSTEIALTPSNLVESVSSPVIGHYVNGAYVNNSNITVNSGTFTGTFDTFSPFVTGANVDVTAIQNATESTKTNIYATNGTINIDNSIRKTINVYSVSGSKIRTIISDSNHSTIAIGKGIYLISVDTNTQKVVVQ